MGIIEKVTLEERTEGNGVSHADIWNESTQEEGKSNAKTLWCSGELKK